MSLSRVLARRCCTTTAFDAHGNTASCIQRVVVKDRTKPTLACPSSLTIHMEPLPNSTAHTAHTFQNLSDLVQHNLSATDNCDDALHWDFEKLWIGSAAADSFGHYEDDLVDADYAMAVQCQGPRRQHCYLPNSGVCAPPQRRAPHAHHDNHRRTRARYP